MPDVDDPKPLDSRVQDILTGLHAASVAKDDTALAKVVDPLLNLLRDKRRDTYFDQIILGVAGGADLSFGNPKVVLTTLVDFIHSGIDANEAQGKSQDKLKATIWQNTFLAFAGATVIGIFTQNLPAPALAFSIIVVGLAIFMRSVCDQKEIDCLKREHGYRSFLRKAERTLKDLP